MTPITRKMSADQSDPAEMIITEPAYKTNYNKVGLFVLFLLALLFLGSTAFYYRENSKLKNNTSQKAIQESIVELVAKVSKLIVLPNDETPIVATVTDPEKLRREQPFFTNANIGDKILIYPKARKAFMYNPKLNLIIEVAPIVLGDQNAQPTPTPPKREIEPTPDLETDPAQVGTSTGTP